MSRVVVVGGGVAGLAAAARLAAAGHRVTLLEQAPEVGGKLGIHQRAGFTFDTGPSLLTMPEVFRELFAATGDPLDRVLPLRRLDPLTSYRWPDGTLLDLPAEAQRPVRRWMRRSGPGPASSGCTCCAAGRGWRRRPDRLSWRLRSPARQSWLASPCAGPPTCASSRPPRPCAGSAGACSLTPGCE